MSTAEASHNFIRAIIAEDLASNRHGGRVVTRFPPEPNGYLHIGHAKSICLNFGIARDIPGAVCHLRFDDTNPAKEDQEFVDSIQADVRWLGFDWGEKMFFASDYFERLYQFAEELIQKGKAYVCSLSEAEVKRGRGSITEPGVASPDRDRPVAENLELFRGMRAGKYRDGELVLRAKIDMAAANMKMRDPAIYRIRHHAHHRTGDQWCIYPLYDFTHGLSDSLEHITHSLCTLEFENNRELYDWFLAQLDVPSQPQQIEFARLNLTYTVMSKRKLRELVEGGHVSGWDDPRMPTLSGLRRAGYTPGAIRNFADRVGVARANSTVDLSLLEYSIREDLNASAPRVLCVLDPLEVVIENFPAGQQVELEAPYFPEATGSDARTRKLSFGGRLWIERDDFQENPAKGFHRLAPGVEVRLRHAFVVRCERVEKDAGGQVQRLICSYDASTLNAAPGDGRRVAGTIHWVNQAEALPVQVRVYDRLFSVLDPDREEADFKDFLNANSVRTYGDAKIEASVLQHSADTRYQFERLGYFWQDPALSKPDALLFGRIVSLKDSWAKAVEVQTQGSSHRQAEQEQRREERERLKREQVELAKQQVLVLDPAAEAYAKRFGLQVQLAHTLSTHPQLGAFFEAALAIHPNARSLANWVTTEVMHELKERDNGDLVFTAAQLARLVALVDQGTISARAGKDVFARLAKTGEEPEKIVAELGLTQLSDKSALLVHIDQVLAQFPDKVAAYRAGNANLMGLFVGQVMKLSGGRADPKVLAELLTERLR